MIIAAIVATGLKNEIGKDNKLIWHMPADLKFFKNTTMGCPIIMGRKTYESIGKPLPGRQNIIITRNTDYKVVGAEIHTSIDSALNFFDQISEKPQKVFIIGGADIFNLCMPRVHEIYRTLVRATFDADVYMSPINEKEFELVWQECHEADEKNPFGYCFQKWKRKGITN
jgi:dihydrofolate reductase